MASGGLQWPKSGLRVAQSGLTVGVLSPKRALKDCCSWALVACIFEVVCVARRIV